MGLDHFSRPKIMQDTYAIAADRKNTIAAKPIDPVVVVCQSKAGQQS